MKKNSDWKRKEEKNLYKSLHSLFFSSPFFLVFYTYSSLSQSLFSVKNCLFAHIQKKLKSHAFNKTIQYFVFFTMETVAAAATATSTQFFLKSNRLYKHALCQNKNVSNLQNKVKRLKFPNILRHFFFHACWHLKYTTQRVKRSRFY